ncbi:MAG: SH3 domain-containing protein, partial [Thermodesulfobacteriota bacterium]
EPGTEDTGAGESTTVPEAGAATVSVPAVSSPAVVPTPPPAAAVAPAAAAVTVPAVAMIRSTVDVLNMRSVPDVKGSTVGRVMPGETATVLETRGDWLKIQKPDGVTGYVAREYTQVISEAGASAAVATATAIVAAPVTMIRSTADVLNMRSVPAVKGSKVGRLMPGETATVLETRGDWLKIQKPDGVTGYVAREYTEAVPQTPPVMEDIEAPVPQPASIIPPVSVKPEPVETVASTPGVQKIRSTSESLSIRTEPYGNKSVGQLGLNEEVEVVETLAEWIKIKKPDGTTGYVPREYTAPVNN